MKYAILTFGCRTNQADSFDLERDLRARGGEETRVESADLVLVNTCSVTATAEQAARQAIRRVARLNPRARIVATGCYATRRSPDLVSLPVWRVVRNDIETGVGVLGGGDPRVAPARLGPMPGPGTRGRTLCLLRVQTGCNEGCTYCIVPATRGRSRSVPLAVIVHQVAEAAGAGYKEAVVTGVHLGCYGRDLEPVVGLSDLVRVLSAHPADIRFRLSAVEPMDVGDDVIGALAGTDRFARHFHLPLQHASDRILSAMARPYTLERYASIVNRLCDRFPDAAIGADLIVGFPGETEADFETCATYLAASPLAYVHVFPFSPRPGTQAARLGARQPAGDVRRRVRCLRGIGADLGRRFRRRFVGTVREGLTIGDGSLVLTDNYLRVRIPPGHERNERVKVRIVEDGELTRGVLV